MIPLVAAAVNTVSAWVLLCGLVGGAWMFFRGGGRTAISSLETANRVLAARVDEQDKIITAQTSRIAELEAKTDVAQATEAAIRPLIEQLDHADRRAEERNLLLLNVCQMIADRLGPDPETA